MTSQTTADSGALDYESMATALASTGRYRIPLPLNCADFGEHVLSYGNGPQ